ncbi:hypothetical protein SRM1_03640 [Pseudomonas fluorescens]|nr:hypothetical protein SRM1_03640 [Pseudomonas fluorescens]
MGFLFLTQARRCGKQHVGGGVQRGFGGILQHANNETYRNHLHGDLAWNAKQAARQRDQQQRATGHTRSAAGADRGDDTQQDRRRNIHGNAQRVHCGQGQHGNGDCRAGHVDRRAQRDRYRVRVFVQAQTLAQFQVDRNVRRRTAGEECSDAAFAQALEGQRIRVTTQLPEHDQRIHHQRHEQHAAQQHRQQVRIPHQRAETGRGQRRSDQAEDPQWSEANHHAHDYRDTVGQITQHFAGSVAGMTNRDAHADRPGQNADEVGVHQRTHRVIHHAEQQALQHFTDTARRGYRNVLGGQYQIRREQHARDHSHRCCGEGAQQVKEQNRTDVSFLAVLVVGDRRHDQHEHQNRRHGFQCRNEHLADKRRRFRRFRREHRQDDTGNQADHDLRDQAQVFQALQ